MDLRINITNIAEYICIFEMSAQESISDTHNEVLTSSSQPFLLLDNESEDLSISPVEYAFQICDVPNEL